MYTLLIAEDEDKLRFIIKEYFLKQGFLVLEAENGAQALELAEEQEPDLVLLDVMMPGLDGFSVCKAIRKKRDTPIMFLTARTAEEDQLRGFQLKADDYITKPFSLPILHAKVQALLARKAGMLSGSGMLQSQGIQVDLHTREVTVDGKGVSLPPRVYDLLVWFMEHPNQIFTRQQLLDQVWGKDSFCYDRAVDTAVKKLRQALGDRAGCIKTIIKVGYKFS